MPLPPPPEFPPVIHYPFEAFRCLAIHCCLSCNLFSVGFDLQNRVQHESEVGMGQDASKYELTSCIGLIHIHTIDRGWPPAAINEAPNAIW